MRRTIGVSRSVNIAALMERVKALGLDLDIVVIDEVNPEPVTLSCACCGPDPVCDDYEHLYRFSKQSEGRRFDGTFKNKKKNKFYLGR
jgi:hypothetical protein